MFIGKYGTSTPRPGKLGQSITRMLQWLVPNRNTHSPRARPEESLPIQRYPCILAESSSFDGSVGRIDQHWQQRRPIDVLS